MELVIPYKNFEVSLDLKQSLHASSSSRLILKRTGNMIIYKTTNLLNGKIYVGFHKTDKDDGYLGSGKLIKRALKKYGRKNFIRETLEIVNKDQWLKRETYWIEKLNSRDPKIGYNIAPGGEKPPSWLGKKFSEEHKKNLSESLKGHEVSDEVRKYLSKIKTGLTYSDEVNKKKGRKGKKHPMYGKKHSDETKEKISKNHYDVSGGRNPKAQKVEYKGIVYNTIKEAQETTGDSMWIVRKGIKRL